MPLTADLAARRKPSCREQEEAQNSPRWFE